MIVMTVLCPLRVITSLPMGIKILKIGEKNIGVMEFR
jgi:hypothetical protein